MFSLRLGSFFALEIILGEDFRLRIGTLEINRCVNWWGIEDQPGTPVIREVNWFVERIRAVDAFERHLTFCRN